MKISNAAVRLAMGGLAMGAGLVVARLLARGRRGESPRAAAEPPPPEQLIGAPKAHLSAIEAAEAFRGPSDTADKPH